MSQMRGLPNFSGSDHIPVECHIAISIEKETPIPNKIVIRRGVTDKQIITAMMNSPWPIIPWNKIPAIMEFLTEVRVPRT